MGYIKDKNLITYKGTKYTITCNMTDGTVTTNHPDGKSYIVRTVCNGDNDLGRLIYLVSQISNINRFIETIATQAPNLLQVLAHYHRYRKDNININKQCNQYIEIIQKNWKKIQKHPYPIIRSLDDDYFTKYIHIIASNIELNELEMKWYGHFDNVDFVKHFAGQFEMYHPFINTYPITRMIQWYNGNKISIQPFLKNKNLLQVITDLNSNMIALNYKGIDDGLKKVYNKYKFLEMTDADGYNYRLLKTTQEFQQEANNMHNCLFRMGYNEKVAQEKSLIIVVTRPDGIKIDMEVDLADGKLKQAYYRKDVNLVKDDKQHLKSWVDGLREKLLSLAQTED